MNSTEGGEVDVMQHDEQAQENADPPAEQQFESFFDEETQEITYTENADGDNVNDVDDVHTGDDGNDDEDDLDQPEIAYESHNGGGGDDDVGGVDMSDEFGTMTDQNVLGHNTGPELNGEGPSPDAILAQSSHTNIEADQITDAEPGLMNGKSPTFFTYLQSHLQYPMRGSGATKRHRQCTRHAP